MTFLTALLPGLRDLRTPLTVGTLWLACAGLVAYPHSDWVRDLQVVEAFDGIVAALGLPLAGPALVFGAYLVGVLAQGSQSAIRKLPAAEHARTRLRGSTNRTARWLARKMESPGTDAKRLVRSTMEERLRPFSSYLAELTPVGLVVDEFELASLRLSKDAPEQYQQYDRLRSEAEFRGGISAPLLVFGGIAASTLPGLAAVAVVVLALTATSILLNQAVEQRHRAEELLASALYFEYTSTPLLDTLTEAAKSSLSREAEDPEAATLAWLCDFLHERSLMRRHSELLAKVRHPSRGHRRLIERAAPLMSRRTAEALRLMGHLETENHEATGS